MTTTPSRRSVLAGAAAAPVLALPAPASEDAELIALGQQLEPIIARWQVMVKAYRADREAFEQMVFEATGIRDEDWRAARDTRLTPSDFLADPYLVERDRLAKLREKTNPDPDPYLERYTENQDEAGPILEAIFERPARTIAGLAVKARAAAYWNGEHDWEDGHLVNIVDDILALAGVSNPIPSVDVI